MRRMIITVLLALSVCVLSLAGCNGGGTDTENTQTGSYKIAVVPKLTSANWFQRMENGIKQYNAENGTDYFYGGPTDATEQAAYLEQLLAEDWDAICIVPFDSESLAPILKKAKQDGVVIITHEAASMDPEYFDYDVEAFRAADFGENFAKQIDEQTGGEGTYIQYVSSLNAVSHAEWCDACDKYMEKNSGMKKLGRYETNDDMTMAYNQTKELLQAHPEINAILGCCSTDIAGAARAVKELGLAGKVTLVGASIASVCKEYVEDGTVKTFSLWDSGEAGKAMVALAEKVLDGKETFDPATCSLSIPGYEQMQYADGVFYGSARVDVTPENLAEYDY